jgi:hypothetical protein
VWRNMPLSILRWFITRCRTKWYLVYIVVLFIPESPVFTIIIFTITIATTTYIYTSLTIIRITTTVTQIRPTYFSIRTNTINYNEIWILTKFTERIQVIVQLFMDFLVFQRTPTGKRHWDINTEKNICRSFKKSIIKFIKVLQWMFY